MKKEISANTIKADVLIVGSGLASLALALKLPPTSQVVILTKSKSSDTNTAMAQGGIAAVMSEEDSFDRHIEDTLTAGVGLCKIDVVKNIVDQAPERIKDLQKWGVHFDVRKLTGESSSEVPEIDLTREGGHSFRRILHFEDQTGAEIHRSLLKKVREADHIKFLEDYFAIDLILNKQVAPFDMKPNACVGVYALEKSSGEVRTFVAKHTILASGGAGKVYLYTTNWEGATGDGIAMAFRAGCRVGNLEFTQFHPTCLFHPEARNFLISEALRGEGGELITSSGQPFMKKYHPLGSLAPRDIVARSIDAEMKKSGDSCVFLDMTHLDSSFLKGRFPAIYSKCLQHGIDMAIQPIPVVPAAHYQCGGIVADVNGCTDLPGLWAIGETACTGLHGANRLASNSLLECLAMAHNCAQVLSTKMNEFSENLNLVPSPWMRPLGEANADEMIVINHMWEEIRRLMWNYVGIVRSNKRLKRAQSRLGNILEEVGEYYSNMQVHSDIIELRNIAIVAALTVECALRRRESRGIHFNLDFPTDPGSGVLPKKVESSEEAPKDSLIFQGQSDRFHSLY